MSHSLASHSPTPHDHSSFSSLSDLWVAIQQDLKICGGMADYAFESYLGKLSLVQDTGKVLQFQYPSGMLILWVDVNYKEDIEKSAQRVLGSAREAQFVEEGISADAQTEKPPVIKASKTPQLVIEQGTTVRAPRKRKEKQPCISGLNTAYNFESFVAGPNNEFALASAKAVAESTHIRVNPLFIHGASGMGKTHLLHAIGNAIMERDEKKQVLYITSEDFTNTYIDCVMGKKGGDGLSVFRRKFRRADVLLIDDIQFMANKEKTEEEFFHTFNTLFNSGKQIVLSADCPPTEIAKMNKHLISRFEQGLVASIQRPNYETRLAILRDKCRQWKSAIVTEEVLEFLAENISSSVRRLEGALTRVASYASFSSKCPQIGDLRLQLGDLLQEQKGTQLSIDDIKKHVAQAFDLKVSELTGRRRTAHIAQSRQIAMYLARQRTRLSLQDIGDAFGGRDHGTVIHAARTVEKKMNEDMKLRELVSRMQEQL